MLSLLLSALCPRSTAMRSLVAVVLAALVFPASASIVSTPGTNIRSQRDILGCADVRAFGAVGNGVADDTAAIQAAINSFSGSGGPVCLPPGVYKITDTLTLKKTSSLIGSNSGSRDGIGADPASCVIDATTLPTSGYKVAILGAPNSVGVEMSGFRLKGPPAVSAGTSIGISPGGGAMRPVIRNINVTGFYIGIWLNATAGALVQNVWADLQANAGLDIYGGSEVTVLGSLFANVGGTLGDGGPGNLRCRNGAASVYVATPTSDEGFGTSASILILDCYYVTLTGMRVFYTHGGYGIRLGDGTNNPTSVTLRDLRVQRFAAAAAPIAGIELRGSGHILQNVVVDVAADGGTVGLSDLATGTKMYGVTSTSSGGTTYVAVKDAGMPTVYPGSGSKQFWIDPSDAASTTYLRFAQ